ncbi:hypothetical protein [Salinarimonas soli]|uniref:Uncharacterized protein n=1 Tax=Salinarimonas soli TaxID=1638099 RepID=A0A5B2VE28_9HYPH|nr:hypothetical protein [Salinarimonas soli]KAA2236397.1 hypothetical protein F0L46_14740 [Salinarimonas soli]
MLRLVVPALAGLALSASAALAGGAPCVTCYREAVHPPVYGTYHERVMTRAPRTLTHVIPARYETVTETVVVAPERRVWQVSLDPYGRRIGCWVTIPAQYETRHRQVLVQPEEIVPVAIPARYGHVAHPVLIEPARRAWVPVGRPVYKD